MHYFLNDHNYCIYIPASSLQIRLSLGIDCTQFPNFAVFFLILFIWHYEPVINKKKAKNILQTNKKSANFSILPRAIYMKYFFLQGNYYIFHTNHDNTIIMGQYLASFKGPEMQL